MFFTVFFGRTEYASPLGAMKQSLATIVLLGLVAFTASVHAVPEEESNLDAVVSDVASAQNALRESKILLEVFQALAQDEELDSESDEYFFRELWNKTKDALKKATKKVKDSFQGAFEEAKGNIKQAAKDANRKLKDKAAEIISKLITKISVGAPIVGGSAEEESKDTTEFMKLMLKAIR